jgi:hypothetical protein
MEFMPLSKAPLRLFEGKFIFYYIVSMIYYFYYSFIFYKDYLLNFSVHIMFFPRNFTFAKFSFSWIYFSVEMWTWIRFTWNLLPSWDFLLDGMRFFFIIYFKIHFQDKIIYFLILWISLGFSLFLTKFSTNLYILESLTSKYLIIQI